MYWWFSWSVFFCFGLFWALPWGLAQESEFELPKLDELIDLSVSEPGDASGEGDVQAQLRSFWDQQGLPDEPEARIPFALPTRPLEQPEASRMLTIHSADELLFVRASANFAGALLRLGEDLRLGVDELLGEGSKQRYPCLIHLVDLPALAGEPVSALRIRSYEQLGYRVELALREGQGLNALSLQRLLLEMILMERVAQGALARDAGALPELPQWLVTGVGELIRKRNGHLDASAFRQALRAGVQVNLEQVLEYQERELGDAQQRNEQLACAALVHSLLEAGEGKFLHWLNKARKNPQQQRQELVSFFVEFGLQAEELEKRYQASWVKLAQSSALQRYGVEESKQVLLQNLVSVALVDGQRSETEPGLSVAECLEEWVEPDLVLLGYWRKVLLANQERVHPLYGGVVVRGRRLFEQLEQGRLDLSQARLQWQAELREMEVILAIMKRIELRLNEYQLNFGQGDLAWVEQLARQPAFKRSRSLLPQRGILQRRLDWAEEEMRLERAQAKSGEEASLGLEELEEVVLD